MGDGVRQRRMKALAGLAFAGTAAALAFGFLGHLHPALDSFSHFRVHLAVLLVAMAVVILFMRLWLLSAVALIVGAGSIFVTLGGFGIAGPTSVSAETDTAGHDRATYRVLHLNLHYDNATPERVISLIGRERPDIVALTEVSDMWRERLDSIARTYPHGTICPPPTHIGGVAILSRRPLAGDEPVCHEHGALATATVDLSGHHVDIAALHLGLPWPFNQPNLLPRVSDILSGLGDTAIVTGDFNAAPWSWTVRRITSEGRFRLVGGLGSTWLFLGLPDLLRRHAGLPIDHVLVKGGVVTLSARKLEDVGSDHLPILHEFMLLPSEPRREVLRASLAAER